MPADATDNEQDPPSSGGWVLEQSVELPTDDGTAVLHCVAVPADADTTAYVASLRRGDEQASAAHEHHVVDALFAPDPRTTTRVHRFHGPSGTPHDIVDLRRVVADLNPDLPDLATVDDLIVEIVEQLDTGRDQGGGLFKDFERLQALERLRDLRDRLCAALEAFPLPTFRSGPDNFTTLISLLALEVGCAVIGPARSNQHPTLAVLTDLGIVTIWFTRTAPPPMSCSALERLAAVADARPAIARRTQPDPGPRGPAA